MSWWVESMSLLSQTENESSFVFEKRETKIPKNLKHKTLIWMWSLQFKRIFWSICLGMDRLFWCSPYAASSASEEVLQSSSHWFNESELRIVWRSIHISSWRFSNWSAKNIFWLVCQNITIKTNNNWCFDIDEENK